jgi:predicted aspartyl protease
MWYDVGLVVLTHQNDEVGSIKMFGCFLFMLHMCLYLQISHFTIQCFICEDLVNMQCILGSISVSVVSVEPDST